MHNPENLVICKCGKVNCRCARPKAESTTTVTLDWKSSELVSDILDMLHHVANTTTCEATKKYLTEKLEYLTGK